MKANLLDAVVGAASEHDILPILLEHIKVDDLEFFLEKLTLVCKLWHRACRKIDSPDRRLRRALETKDFHLTSLLQVDCLWLNDPIQSQLHMTRIDRIVSRSADSDSAKQIAHALLYKAISNALVEYGGWQGRECRRRNGYLLQEGKSTYSPPPSAIRCIAFEANTQSATMDAVLSHTACVRTRNSYSMTKRDFDTLLEWDKKYHLCPAMEEKHAALWNNLWKNAQIDRPLAHNTGVVVLLGTAANGNLVVTYYIEVHCYDYTSIGSQLVRLPHITAQRFCETVQARQLPVHWPCSSENRAISPWKSGWETL